MQEPPPTAIVILLCAAARSDIRNSARSVAASLLKIVLMVSSVYLSVKRTLEQCALLEKVTPSSPMRNCASGNLEIPGSMLSHRPGMTKSVAVVNHIRPPNQKPPLDLGHREVD